MLLLVVEDLWGVRCVCYAPVTNFDVLLYCYYIYREDWCSEVEEDLHHRCPGAGDAMVLGARAANGGSRGQASGMAEQGTTRITMRVRR